MVTASAPLAREIAGRRQVTHDAVGGALGDPDHLADLAEPNRRVPCDCNQDLRVIGKEAPAAQRGLVILDFYFIYTSSTATRKRLTMHHLKCAGCRIRFRAPQPPAGGLDELCPACGSLLEPAHNLSELIGLQERQWEDSDELAASSDARRWLADGDSVTPEAVANALFPPEPRASD